MQQKAISVLLMALYFLILVFADNAFSYKIPPTETNIKYLYVFGKDGKKVYGALNEPQVVFLRVPISWTGKIKVAIYDPDIGGSIDEKSGRWDTETRFSIYGKGGTPLYEQRFGNDRAYDKKFYNFPEIDASKGEETGDFRYFRIAAEGLSGDDNNIFSLDISPDNIEAFTYRMSFRLSESRETKMMFYPEIPVSTDTIVEHNYDLDKTGGTINLISPSNKVNEIKESNTGSWADTKITVLPADAGKRWDYEISKGTQINANMAVYFTTGKGSLVPIFFEPAKRDILGQEKVSCNTFTFDGSKSYDPDNQRLAYFWDFGDGTTSAEVKAVHSYKEAGKYLVQLTVFDNSEADCNTGTVKHIVKVNEPPKAAAEGANISCVNKEISFDASASKDAPEDKLIYVWDFGDGQTSEGIKAVHKYEKGGEYQVSLTVKDDSGTICDTGMDTLGVVINTPPIADAGKDIEVCAKNPNDLLEVTFDGSGSKDPDGDKLTYIWDFGDGSSDEGRTVTHNYKKGGKYNVRLLVTDSSGAGCDTATAVKVVTLNRSPLADAGKDLEICLSEEAKFDATASLDNDGNNITCTWDFGDGETAQGLKVSHKYKKGGIYKIELAVDDGTGTQCARSYDLVSAAVNTAPSADLKAESNVCLGAVMDFDASLSKDPDGDMLVYTWDFGDGVSGNGRSVKYTYEKGGLYKVVLSVDDARNSKCSSSSKVHYVDVNTPPVAAAGSDKVVCIDKPVEYDASLSYDKDNDTLKYVWEFGDGYTAEGVKVMHTYKGVGIYKAILTVTDDSGTSCNTSVAAVETTVNAQPVPVIEVL